MATVSLFNQTLLIEDTALFTSSVDTLYIVSVYALCVMASTFAGDFFNVILNWTDESQLQTWTSPDLYCDTVGNHISPGASLFRSVEGSSFSYAVSTNFYGNPVFDLHIHAHSAV
jgi:hypothetical protein